MVVFSPEARLYLEELAHILYFKNYFGSQNSAEEYVRELHAKIMHKLPTKIAKVAPPYFMRFGYGMSYAAFPQNKRTTWYVFFITYRIDNETIYLIRHINNNHFIGRFV